MGIFCALLLGGCPAGAWGDVFLLANGGRVEGELLNPEEKPREKYIIRLASGGQVTLAAAQVKEVIAVRPEEEEYQKLARGSPDTVEGHWAMAEWCRQQRMFSQRDTHLERIIELDPDHGQARAALGYTRIDGRWAKRDETMLERGYVRYKGRWRLRQEVELLEAKRQQELAEKEWFQKLERWRSWLVTERAPLARQSLLAIDDPHAVKGLIHGLRHDPQPSVRAMYVDILAKLGTPEALQALAVAALEDRSDDVRLTCLEHLQKKRSLEAVHYFVGQLKSKDNRIVNLAGFALGRMKDVSAIGPLIDALETTHKFTVTKNPGTITTGFGSGPGAPPGGLSVGGGTKVYSQTIANQSVLDALVEITGRNFGFDQRAWKQWFLTQRRLETFDARRDNADR
jgi:hypothetical protein